MQRAFDPDEQSRARELRARGLKLTEIAQALGCSKSTASRLVATREPGCSKRRSAYQAEKARLEEIPLAPVTAQGLPLRIGTGKMWRLPVKTQRCCQCDLLALCRRHVARGDFIGCEAALAREVLPKAS